MYKLNWQLGKNELIRNNIAKDIEKEPHIVQAIEYKVKERKLKLNGTAVGLVVLLLFL